MLLERLFRASYLGRKGFFSAVQTSPFFRSPFSTRFCVQVASGSATLLYVGKGLHQTQNPANSSSCDALSIVPDPVQSVLEEKRQEKEESSGIGARLRRIVSDLTRTLQLACIFAPCIVLFPFWYIVPVTERWRDWWLHVFVYCVQHAGPMYIKLGQWASTRADLFSVRLRKALGTLHDQCFHEKWWQTRRTIEESLQGADLESVFEEFDPSPIGAGCIAQVHRARLAKTGQTVAVKVQRSRVRRLIEQDLSLMRRFVWIVNTCLPDSLVDMVSLKESSDLFGDFMESQMDFRREAANLQRFAENFKGSSLQVRFPKALFASENGQLLVETLEEGVSLARMLDEGTGSDTVRRQIGSIGVRAFLKMVLIDNFCHSDLHPGNMLVRFTPGTNQTQLDGLTLLDVGLTTTLSAKNQRNFIDLFAAVATGNGRLAGELMIERQDPEKLGRCKDPQGFVNGIEQVVSKVKFDSFRLDRVQIGSVLEQVLSLVHQYSVPIDPSFTNLILSIVVLEGLGRQLDPTLDIFKESLPLLWRLDKSWRIAAMQALRS